MRSNACGAVVAWLPQTRPEQICCLRVGAQGCEGPVFLYRPEAVARQALAAPLRVQATFDLDWHLCVRVIKRRGPIHDGVIRLCSTGLATGREGVRRPSSSEVRAVYRQRPAVAGPSSQQPDCPFKTGRSHSLQEAGAAAITNTGR